MIKHAENNAEKKNLEFIKLISEFTALQTTNKYLDAIQRYIFFLKNLFFPQAGFSKILKSLTDFFC